MSNTAQGPGWWLASDGKWYPPELWTGPPSEGPAAGASGPVSQPAQPTYPGQPTYPAQAQPTYPAQPAYPAQSPSSGPPYGATTPPGYAGYGTGSPYPGSMYPVQQKTNGMAVAALICGIAGFLFITGILGIIFGFIARSQIKASNGRQKGAGMALAGILVGVGWVALAVIGIVFNHHTTNGNTGVINSGILMGQFGLGGLFG